MATIIRTLSSKKDKTTGKSEILIRFKQGNILDQRAKTNIFISSKYWDVKTKNILVKDRIQTDATIYHIEAKTKLSTLENVLAKAFNDVDKTNIVDGWVQNILDRHNFPERYIESKCINNESFSNAYAIFLLEHKVSESRKKMFKVLDKVLKRFELYNGTVLDFDTMNNTTIRDFEKFLTDEHLLYSTHSYIYEVFPVSRKPEPRSKNTIIGIHKAFKTFLNWCIDTKHYTTNNPYIGFSIGSATYGTPYYLSKEELKQLADFDLSSRKGLEVQRDIFLFHCNIGCRVGDLINLTKDNVINDEVHYIPRKTKEGDPITVSVPLNSTAKNILSKYSNTNSTKLLPFLLEQKYNQALKQIFTIVGITRKVVVLNPLTTLQESVALNDVVSSHIARRTFIGNIYDRVADPNLIGKLSGHTEGSKAFARYRDISKEQKQTLVNFLEI